MNKALSELDVLVRLDIKLPRPPVVIQRAAAKAGLSPMEWMQERLNDPQLRRDLTDTARFAFLQHAWREVSDRSESPPTSGELEKWT